MWRICHATTVRPSPGWNDEPSEASKSPAVRGFPSAPERTRTSTDHKVHKALNLARLPIPPQALEAASIAPHRSLQGFSEVDGGGRDASAWLRTSGSIESVLEAALQFRTHVRLSPDRRAKRARSGPSGLDQTSARDLRFHQALLGEVRLSAHRARHRQGGRSGVVLDGPCPSGQPGADRPAPARSHQAAGDRTAGSRGRRRAQPGATRAAAGRPGGRRPADPGRGEHRGLRADAGRTPAARTASTCCACAATR